MHPHAAPPVPHERAPAPMWTIDDLHDADLDLLLADRLAESAVALRAAAAAAERSLRTVPVPEQPPARSRPRGGLLL